MECNLLLKENKQLKERLARRLRKYNLILMPTAGAESHGPHIPDMNFMVWIVYVKKRNPKNQGWVVMYPRVIYWIDDPTDWWKREDECRIFRKGRYGHRKKRRLVHS